MFTIVERTHYVIRGLAQTGAKLSANLAQAIPMLSIDSGPWPEARFTTYTKGLAGS